MVLFLLFSFNDLKTENQPNPFAIQIADTIIITSLNPEALTAEIPSEFLQISYTIEHKGKSPLRDKQKPLKKSSLKKSSMKKSPNSNSPKTKRNNPSSSTQPLQNPIILTRSRRSQASNTLPKGSSSGNTSSVSQHQKALIELKLDELKARLEADSFDTANKKAKTIPLESLLCYKGVKDLPKDIRVNEIYIDKKAFAVVFPIKTGHFPVHICLIKTVSKYFEQPFLYLRFNFYHYQDKGINKDLVFPIETPDFCFKELIFRSTDQHKLTAVFKTVKDLQKAFKEHEDNEQVPIEVLKGPVLAILKDVKLRPNITGRKTIGHLELKERGFRFVSNKSEVVEIPFNMVKKAIFQPCNDPSDQDYLIILHFHCKSPIKISNNKSFEDIQVFLEAAGTYARDVGKGDSEEDEEKEAAFERKNRMKTNKEFEEFAKATEKESKGKIIFDMPFKELGFLGNPFKAMVMVMPTVSYLVSLVEKPFFLVDLEEIDFACLERIPVSFKPF